MEIDQITKKRQQEKEKALSDLRQKLLKAKQQVKIELEQNIDLNSKVGYHGNVENEQA